MEYIHVKNIENYQPSYKDGRRLIWVRWEIDCLGDHKIFQLTPAQRWLFLGLICLETRNQDEIPIDDDWLCGQIGYPKQHISKDLKMLQTLELVVTKCNEESKSLCPTDRQMLKQTEVKTESNVHFDFNLVWDKYPNKVGKKDAERHFKASMKTNEDFSSIQTALDNYCKSARVRKGYVMNGGRWFLNWQDWVNYKEPVTEKDKTDERDKLCFRKS